MSCSAAAMRCDHALVIVESPGKCARIQQFLETAFGAGSHKVVATGGHLLHVPSLASIDKVTFEPAYEVTEHARATVDSLRREVARAASVALATDADREGEAIAYHLCTVLDLDSATTPRIVFREITPDVVVAAMLHPRRIDMHLVHAQKARAVVDMLVGFNLSPLLWKYIGNGDRESVLSAGRCQTPALRLIYDHWKSTEQEKIDKSLTPRSASYHVEGKFVFENLQSDKLSTFVLTAQLSDTEIEPFIESSRTFEHRVCASRSDRTHRLAAAPLPFNTSELLQSVGTTLRFSVRETMDLCQTLYQEGFITYMRTDSRKMSASFLESARTRVSSLYDGRGSESSSVLAEPERWAKLRACRSDAEPHECIRPTRADALDVNTQLPGRFSSKHQAVYKLICRQTLQACMACAEYEGFKVVVCAPHVASRDFGVEPPNAEVGDFVDRAQARSTSRASALIIDECSMERPQEVKQNELFYECLVEYASRPGWTLAGGGETRESVARKRKEVARVQEFLSAARATAKQEGLRVKMECLEATAVASEPMQPHFTEATLLRALECRGIGRASTFASIVNTVQKRKYAVRADVPGRAIACRDYKFVVSENSKVKVMESTRVFGHERARLVLQPLGRRVAEFLVRHFEPVVSYFFTAILEGKLDAVARGELEWSEVCRECSTVVRGSVREASRGTRTPFSLDDHHKLLFTRSCPVIQQTVCGDDGVETTKMLSVRPGVDLDIVRLREGGYKVDDLLEIRNEFLGEYEGEPLLLRRGKYGFYAQWGEQRASLRGLVLDGGHRSVADATFADVVRHLTSPTASSPGATPVLRQVTPSLSVRRGKGKSGTPYLHYQTRDMKRPRFVSLSKFQKENDGFDPMTCDASVLETMATATAEASASASAPARRGRASFGKFK